MAAIQVEWRGLDWDSGGGRRGVWLDLDNLLTDWMSHVKEREVKNDPKDTG